MQAYKHAKCVTSIDGMICYQHHLETFVQVIQYVLCVSQLAHDTFNQGTALKDGKHVGGFKRGSLFL